MADLSHFKDLLQALNSNHVDFLVVGGYAVMKYTEPRFTKDFDIWVRDTQHNSESVFLALIEFGAPLDSDNLNPHSFTSEIVYQIGVPPLRIDILTRIDGVTFNHAWANRVVDQLFELQVYFISLEDLIVNKKASGRGRDLEDLQSLKRKRQKKR